MMDEAEKSEDIRRFKKKLRLQPLRYVHILFSMILTTYGVGIFLATLTVKTHLLEYEAYLYYYLGRPVLVLYGSSVMLVVLGCLGIIASGLNLCEGIITFGVFMFGLFMFELTIGAVFLALSDSADRSITRVLEIRLNDYTEYHTSIDYIQITLGCCGISDFTDWNSTLGYIPGSCCNSDSACGLADILGLNESGCHSALKELINLFINNLIIIMGVLVALQVTSMVITLFLARGIIDYRRRILQFKIDERNRIGEPETPEVHNPLGARSDDIPLPGRTSGGQMTRPGFRIGQNYARNPTIYKETSFNRNNYPGQNTAQTAARLPRAHRRFPLANVEPSWQQGYNW